MGNWCAKRVTRLSPKAIFDAKKAILMGLGWVFVLVQRENEGEIRPKGRFRPSGGDFQGIGVYRSDIRFL